MNPRRRRRRSVRGRQRHSPDMYRAFANHEWRNAIQASIEVPLLARALQIPTGLRVLEIGCGRGIGLEALARVCQPSLLVGLDIDDALLDMARRQLARRGVTAELVHGDARQMPFSDGSFDLVVDFGTCYHVPGPRAALAEIARVLAEGGLFVHETRIAQLLAHPIRSHGGWLPWEEVPALAPRRYAGLWSSRVRSSTPRTE